MSRFQIDSIAPIKWNKSVYDQTEGENVFHNETFLAEYNVVQRYVLVRKDRQFSKIRRAMCATSAGYLVVNKPREGPSFLTRATTL